MKKSLFYFSLIVIICLSIMYFLNYIEGGTYKKNGFNRKIIDPNIKLINSLTLSRVFMFAGKSDDYILLNNPTDKTHLFKTNYSLNKIDTIKLKIPTPFKTITNVYKGSLGRFLYLTNPFSDILRFKEDTVNYFKIYRLRFDFFWPVSENTFIARARKITNEGKDRELVKVDLSSNPTVSKSYIVPKQRDGSFSNDGWLYYDELKSRVLYMYFYFGEFLCLDSNLNLKYKAKTIDTVTNANIKTSHFYMGRKDGTKRNQTTQTTPQKLTNRHMVTSSNRVYILSGLMADNEILSTFEKNQPIDVYSLQDGKYLHSFYIPKYQGKRLNYFEIQSDKIAAIFGKELVTFSFKDKNY